MSFTPQEIPTGAVRFNTDSSKMEVYIGSTWMEVAVSSPNLGDSSSPAGTRAAFMGGFRDVPVANTTFNTIDYITISTAGNAIDFGDLSAKLFDGAANISSRTRQFAYMGRSGPSYSYSNKIEFITYSTTGNSVDFGDATSTLGYRPSGLSNATRGVRAGGSDNPAAGGTNIIDFITMAAEGNAVDFGDTVVANLRYGGGIASPTRGLILWGDSKAAPGETYVNTIEFITIATTGNSQDFGDLVDGYRPSGAAGNATRGLVTSGQEPETVIQSITLATLGNAIEFGSLSVERNSPSMASSPTRAVMAGGVDYPAYYNTIDYVSIETGGDAIDFGDLTEGRHPDNAGSNAHGGL